MKWDTSTLDFISLLVKFIIKKGHFCKKKIFNLSSRIILCLPRSTSFSSWSGLGSTNPEYVATLKTYLTNKTTKLEVVPAPTGVCNVAALENIVTDQTACIIVQQPNFFGCLEDIEAIGKIARQAGALRAVSFDPLSLAILKRPGDFGADIAVAEGQSLGTPLQFGGPYLGLLACRQQYVRKMPGRLIGKTVDRNGKRCFFLNLQAREQHIRRAGAMSNICTNQGVMALRATV